MKNITLSADESLIEQARRIESLWIENPFA